MPVLDYNFSGNDYQIVATDTAATDVFGSTIGDYLRITVYLPDGTIHTDTNGNESVFYSTLDPTAFNVQLPGRVTDTNVLSLSSLYP